MIRLETFKGIAPAVYKRKLAASMAQVAQEVSLTDGTLQPLSNPGGTVGVRTLPGDRSIFRYNGSWLSWPGLVNVAESPVSEDAYSRIYYTGDGAPKLRATIASVEHVRALGVPAPSTTLTASTSAKTSVSWTRKWYAFYEDADGVRSSEQDIPPGDVTEVVPGQEYLIAPLPPGSGGTLVIWFEAYSAAGSYMGAVYPSLSVYKANNDLLLNGAAIGATQTTGGSDVTVEVEYNTSRLTGFNLERVYVFTWVTDLGEEGPPCDPVTIDVSPAQNVDIVMPTIPPYAWITKKRLYRTVTVDNDTQYQLVAEFDASTSNYTDELYDVDLPEGGLITAEYDPPPSTMQGLVALPGGILAGFVGNTVYFSEPYAPHAWPTNYAQAVSSDIVALGVSGNTLVVATTGTPHTIAGFTPEGMQPSRLSTPYAGASLQGVAELDGVVYYASNNGIVAVNGQSPVLWTETLISTAYWKGLNPSTMRFVANDSRLYVFHDTGFLLFDLSGGEADLTTSAQVVDAFYVDQETDEYFVSVAGSVDIKEYGTGTARTMVYRSKEFAYTSQVKQAVYRVIADSYPVTLRVIADGAPVATVSVTDNEVHRLPATPPNKFWALEVEGAMRIERVETGTSVSELLA